MRFGNGCGAARRLCLVVLFVVHCVVAHGQTVWDTRSDTWVATDALGRVLPGAKEVGPPRKDRTVAMFYFLWHGEHIEGGPYDVTRILAQDPQAMQKADSSLWGPMGAPHHWGEPLFGYYRTDDDYVLRKHAQMLTDAGVDAIVFDASNQLTYRPYYMELLKVFDQVRKAGGKAPKVAFLCPFWAPARVVGKLYRELYAPGLYSDLWLRWDGKPLILADPLLLEASTGNPAQDIASPLTPGHTLGQTLRVSSDFAAVGGRFPTWSTRGAALTLTLRRGGPDGEPVASKRFENVSDNAWLKLLATKPWPAGDYYLEASEARGTIGWWSSGGDTWAGGHAVADGVSVAGDRTLLLNLADSAQGRMLTFFTFRAPQADYFVGPVRADMWSWLEVYPQHVFRNSRGEREQMSVGVAQNAVGRRLAAMNEPGAMGRSYHNGAEDTRPGAVNLGLNFAEQWGRALKEDPRCVFVTGWNEWFAGRTGEFAGTRMPVMFPDEFNQEFSRDLEPMRGGHDDDYYYQLVSFVRRYKGARAQEPATAPRTIRLAGPFSQWASVRPEYRDDIGDAARRDHPAWQQGLRYTNTTGRNDIVEAKVTHDSRFVYLCVRTRDPITPAAGAHWMNLYVDVDGKRATGWEGYDFVVNHALLGPGRSAVESLKAGWPARRVGEARFRLSGREMMLAIRRADLGLPAGAVRFDFKWVDNAQKDGDIDEFTLNGDAAPNGRFNYRYAGSAR